MLTGESERRPFHLITETLRHGDARRSRISPWAASVGSVVGRRLRWRNAPTPVARSRRASCASVMRFERSGSTTQKRSSTPICIVRLPDLVRIWVKSPLDMLVTGLSRLAWFNQL